MCLEGVPGACSSGLGFGLRMQGAWLAVFVIDGSGNLASRPYSPNLRV